MADQSDVRRIAMTLPGVREAQTHDHFGFSVEIRGKAKGFLWVWQERIDPKKPRVPQPKVIAARVANQTEKAALLAADPDVFFTEPHYNGFPAVLVRLPVITEPALRKVVYDAWRCMAQKDLVAAYDAGDATPTATAATGKPARSSPTAAKSASSAKPASSAKRSSAKIAPSTKRISSAKSARAKNAAKRPPVRSSR
jgi:hypothetical protein